MEKIPLKREYLQDYEQKEKEHIETFLKQTFEGKFTEADIFPSPDRFRNLHYPITYRGDMKVPIWPLAAFSKELLMPSSVPTR